MSKIYVLVDERLMAAKNAKRSRHPRHFVVAAYSTMKKAQEAADGYLEALSFAPIGNGWKQGKLKGEITKTESSGKKSDKYGSLHATYRDDEAVLGHLRILTLSVNQPPEDEIDYMTAETFNADSTPRFIPVEVMPYAEWWVRRFGRKYNPQDLGNAYNMSYVVLVRDIVIAEFDTQKEAENHANTARVAISVLGGVTPSEADHPLALKEMDGYKDKGIRGGMNRAETFSAESKFDKLAKEIAADYRKKGKSPEEAMEIGEATAAKIGRAKFGKKKFARMGKSAESVTNFKGEMKTLVQTYVELRYPDDLEMQDAIFENITSGKESVSLKEMQDYVATRSSWYAEIEAVNPSMAVVHNQNDDFVGSIEVLDDSDDPDSVEVFVNDDQMNEVSSTNLYEDGQFWEDYDAETFNAEVHKIPYSCTTYTCRTEIGGTHKGSDAMRFLAFLNEIKNTVGISNIHYEDNMAKGDPFGNVYFKFDICGYGKSNITYLKAYLDGLRNGMIRSGADYEDLHRPIQTLAEGDEPNEEWYMEAETFNAESKKLGIIMAIDRDDRTAEVLGVFSSYDEGKKAMTYMFKEELKERAEDMEEEVLSFTQGKKKYEWYESRSKKKKHLDFYRPTGYDEVIVLKEHGMETLADFEKTFGAETFNAPLTFKEWSQDEMNEELHGGRDMNFEDWLDDEIDSHGKGISLKRWGDEEESESEHQHAESKSMLVRYEVMTTTKNEKEANDLGDKIFDYVEGELGFDCAMEIINGETDENFGAESPFSGSYPPSDEEWEFIQKELRRKGIDTYAEPFDEIGNFYSGKKGMLKIVGLGALVSAGVWITKNKLLE